MNDTLPFRRFADAQLVIELKGLAHGERGATVRLIECLEEFDRRRLYLSEGASSLFGYCTQHLHLCEYAAYARIEIARASRRFPEILNRLRAGRLTLTNAGLLAPHLTPDNHLALLDEAEYKRKDDVKAIIARLKPKPPAVTIIRKVTPPKLRADPNTAAPSGLLSDVAPAVLSSPSLSAPPEAPQASPVRRVAGPAIVPLSAEQFRIQLTISREAREQLREVQELIRHSIPNGDAALIFERAIALLLDKLRKQKFGHARSPRATPRPVAPGSRLIPAAVRREVWTRDGGRCAFVGAGGRCDERGRLEFHHVVPFAAGGTATAENIQLRCRGHNAHEAVVWFGEEALPHRARAGSGERSRH